MHVPIDYKLVHGDKEQAKGLIKGLAYIYAVGADVS